MYENIRNNRPNFCIGPQTGTFCMVDDEASPVVMQVKNTSGTLIRSYLFNPTDTLPSPPDFEFTSIKYVGPYNQSSFYDGAIFYTLERGKTDQVYNKNIIRRWVLDATNFRLDLAAIYTKTSDDDYWYGGRAFCVQNIQTTLADHVSIGTGSITLTTTSGLEKYDTVLIGPSSDVTNIGVVEEAYVHSISGDDVELRTYGGATPTSYEYVSNDPVTIFKDILLFSDSKSTDNEGYLYSLSHKDYGATVASGCSGAFDDVNVATWNNYSNCLSFVKAQNLIHLKMHDYKPALSQNLTLTKPDKVEFIPIYGLDMNGTDIYRLQKEIFQRSSGAGYSLEEWTTYNYLVDTMEPYTNSVTVFSDNTILFYQGVGYVTAIVRDQYGVGLSNESVLFTFEGDLEADLDPPDGQMVTDSNGRCTIKYTAGSSFFGRATIIARASSGNTVHGSSYVYGKTDIPTHPSITHEGLIFSKENDPLDSCSIMCNINGFNQDVYIPCYVRSSFPGGPWIWNRSTDEQENPTVESRNTASYLTSGYYNNFSIYTSYQPILNQLQWNEGQGRFTNLQEEDSSGVRITLPTTNLIQSKPEQYMNLVSVEEAQDYLNLSQNYLSRHLPTGHIVTSTLDQYVFIQEASPDFWSEKNPTNINYWIRLRPFATSLNPSTLKIYFSEASYANITPWIDIAPLGVINTFDAGGGLDGIDFSYAFSEKFHHNSIISIDIRVYDTSPIPNLLTITYWFKIVPDYRIPYIENQYPEIEAYSVPIDTDISFDIKDEGEGVDIETLEVYINNSSIPYSYEEIGVYQYHVVCNLSSNFYYGEKVTVFVAVKDKSENANLLRDGWVFYCFESTGPWFDADNVSPGKCLEGRIRSEDDIHMQVYGINDTGIEYDSIKIEVGGKYRDVKITPIVYRLR